MTEAESGKAGERPNIADKVRFWEEQDRINQELIPRVLKTHELLTEHIAGHHDASTQIAALEARLLHEIRVTRRALLFGATAFVVTFVSIALALVLT